MCPCTSPVLSREVPGTFIATLFVRVLLLVLGYILVVLSHGVKEERQYIVLGSPT